MYDEFFGWIVLIIIFAIAWPVFSSFHSPTNGEHTGYVTAVENSGYVFHTWTAYFKTNTQSSQEDKYCVTNRALVAILQAYQESGEKITIKYDNGFFIPFWQ